MAMVLLVADSHDGEPLMGLIALSVGAFARPAAENQPGVAIFAR